MMSAVWLAVKLQPVLISRSMRLLFVMDPIQSIQIHLDSTFACMFEAQERGHDVLYCQPGHLRQRGDQGWATVQSCQLNRVQGQHAGLSAPESVRLGDLDAVFMRKDPPFNMEYIFSTYLLEAAQPDTLIVNRAENLRNHNEKLYALQFPELCPESLVASHARDIIAFQTELGCSIVVKPLDGNGGEGIFIVRPEDPNRNVIIEMSTRHGARPVLAQRYLPEAKQGDKRILIIDGQFEGAVLRVPGDKDPRGNLHVGATSHKTTLTEREELIVSTLGPRLAAHGHIFVGIDVIGGYLTEINVTSPTGIHEINALDGRVVEARILDAVERRLA